MKKFIHQRQIIFEILLVTLISLTPVIWFLPNHMVIGYDSGYTVNFLIYFLERIYTWQGSLNFGIDYTSLIGQLPLHAFLAFFRYIGVGMYDVQKITFFIWFFAIAISMYSLAYYLYPNKNRWMIRITAVLIYCFNLFLFSFWIQGEQTTFSVFAFFPLSILIILRFLRNENSPLTAAVFLNLAFFVLNGGGIYGVPLLGAVIISCVLLIVYYLLLNLPNKKQLTLFIKRLFLFSIFSLVISVFLNMYFLLPYLLSIKQQYHATLTSAGGVSAAVQWTNYISKYTGFINLLRLQGDLSWYNHPNFYSNAYLVNPILIFGSFIFPIIALLSFFLIRTREEKKIVLFFIILLFVGIFLTAGTHEPLGTYYVFLMEKIPGFAAFRSAYYKFFPIIIFTYALLIGISVSRILDKFKDIRIKIILGSLFLIGILLYNYPFFDRNNFIFEKPFSLMVQIPDYVLNFSKDNNSKSYSYRTLVLPPLDGFAINAFQWGYWSPTSIFSGLTHNNFIVNESSLNGEERYLLSLVYKSLRDKDLETFQALVDKLSIGAIIVRNDVAYGYTRAPTENPSNYLELLNSTHFFIKSKQYGLWSVYTWKTDGMQKIKAINKLLAFKSDNIQDYILPRSKEQFVLQGQNKVPDKFITDKIQIHTCISCQLMTKKDPDPGISVPRILPGSFLYGLKLYRDNMSLKKATTPDQLLDAYLSLSIKRISEIVSLENTDPKSLEESKWISSYMLLDSYWNNINSLIHDKYLPAKDFNTIIKIETVGNSIEKNLTRINNWLGMHNPLIPYYTKVAWNLGYADRTLKKYLEYENIDTKTYLVNNNDNHPFVYIDTVSLPKDELKLNIFIDEKKTIPQMTANYLKIPVESGAHLIKIKIENRNNLFKFLRKDFVSFPDKRKYCLIGDIENYRWDREYFLRATIKNSYRGQVVYLKDRKDIFLTSETFNLESGFFTPTQEISLSEKDPSLLHIFNGKPNSTDINVYFCVNEKDDPEELFEETFVAENISIPLYSVKDLPVNNNRLPKISTEKIDPTHYIIKVRDASSPYILSFSERFSPLWKLSLNSKNISSQHFIINGYANGWIIDKTGNYTLSLEFISQKYFIIGLYITIVTFTLLIIYIVIKIWIKKIKQKIKI